MTLLSGKELRKERFEALLALRRKAQPSFLFLLPKGDPDARSYVDGIERLLRRLDLPFQEEEVAEGEEEKGLLLLRRERKAKQVVLARPLGRREEEFARLIEADHDPDMTTDRNVGRLFAGDLDYLPATAKSVKAIVDHHRIPLQGRKVLLVGRSRTVGLPLFAFFQRRNAMVTVVHSRIDRRTIIESATESDLVVLCSGVEGLIPRQAFRPCQVVLDCGYHDGRGDLGFLPEENELSAYTPVPGGIGALTSSFVVENGFFLHSNSMKNI